MIVSVLTDCLPSTRFQSIVSLIKGLQDYLVILLPPTHTYTLPPQSPDHRHSLAFLLCVPVFTYFGNICISVTIISQCLHNPPTTHTFAKNYFAHYLYAINPFRFHICVRSWDVSLSVPVPREHDILWIYMSYHRWQDFLLSVAIVFLPYFFYWFICWWTSWILWLFLS